MVVCELTGVDMHKILTKYNIEQFLQQFKEDRDKKPLLTKAIIKTGRIVDNDSKSNECIWAMFSVYYPENSPLGTLQYTLDSKKNIISVSYRGKPPIKDISVSPDGSVRRLVEYADIGSNVKDEKLVRYDGWTDIRFPGIFPEDVTDHYEKNVSNSICSSGMPMATP